MLKFEDVERVPIFGDLLKEKIKEKVKEAEEELKEEVEEKVLRANILAVLTSRFGHVNGNTARMINSIDKPRTLQAVFQRALKAQSLTDVKTMLEAKKRARRKKAA